MRLSQACFWSRLSLPLAGNGVPLSIDVISAALSASERTDALILRELILPRILLGLAIGAGLGASGPCCKGISVIRWPIRV